MPGHGHDLLTGFPSRLRQFFPIEAPISMGVRVEGTFAWVGGPFGQVLAGAGAAALLAVAYAVITGRAPRCRLPVLSLALLPVLYALNPLADAPGQGRYALFAVPMAALLAGVGLERAAAVIQHHRGSRDPGWYGRPGSPSSARSARPACAPNQARRSSPSPRPT